MSENPAPCMPSSGRNPNPAKTIPRLPEDHATYKLHVDPPLRLPHTPKSLHQEPSNSTDGLLLSSEAAPRPG